MSVRNGRHSIDFEVFVRSTGGHTLDWTPVSECRLSIVEPLIAQMFHVIVVYVGNSLCYLTSWQSATELKHVLTNLNIDRSWRLRVQKRVVQVVAAANDLNIIDVVTINGWQANTAIVHLASEHFVSEEVVTEDTAIRVSKVM